ncbi:hypothetical protein [Desulfosediminicola sp.]|uniref:hypothetical protein n=1 Tax=Desulfosediminicola sp. TaxID=2886825 RepID=UPI003AF2D942
MTNTLLRAMLALLLTNLVACSGTMNITPPEYRQVKNSYSYEASYDQAWLLAVDWFAENNITIDKIEKTSGLISAKYNIRLHPNALDCGEIKASTLATLQHYEETANVNVTVRSVGDNRTKISVNIAGGYEGMGHDNGWGKKLPFSGFCVSTGVFEQSVANFISTRL